MAEWPWQVLWVRFLQQPRAPSLMQDTFSPLGLPDMARRALPALPSFLGGSGMIRSPLGKSFLSELGPCVSNRGCGSASSCSWEQTAIPAPTLARHFSLQAPQHPRAPHRGFWNYQKQMLEEKAWPAAREGRGWRPGGYLCRNLIVLFMVFWQCSEPLRAAAPRTQLLDILPGR